MNGIPQARLHTERRHAHHERCAHYVRDDDPGASGTRYDQPQALATSMSVAFWWGSRDE